MKIVIGSSMKNRELVRKAMSDMRALGIEPLFPNLDFSDKNEDDAKNLEEKKRLALEHYQAIDEADANYFITPEGYMGTSCKLELGYCIAKGKTVFFSEPTNDWGLDCYVTAFVPLDKLELLKTN